ncbi:sugar transferase [Aurantibacter aestuarii]|uniref:sugar transferase n=1 Tax=Aurantibacter aestuarii TaxID=1266046 RepID=UPI002936F241|nr:sugar transferase [Aurantibacter aestuarii]
MLTDKKNIHFEVSERKILLRIFDVILICFSFFIINQLFGFSYFELDSNHIIENLVLFFYITLFGTIFEMYDLQKSSRLETILTSIMVTTSTTVLFYVLTPYYTPSLPDNRIQILYFFLTIFGTLLIWRYAYIKLISSPRFYKRVLLVGEMSNISSIYKTLQSADPNYVIVGYINCENSANEVDSVNDILEFKPNQLIEVIKKEAISEVVIATYNSEAITSKLYEDLLLLLESGFPIKEYTQAYEDMMFRVPVQFVGKDFYKYFPFSRNNQNRLYLASRRFLDVLIAIVGLCFSVIFLPIVLIGNLLANRGPMLYTQLRVGKNAKPFKIYKLRSMIVNAEEHGAVWATKNDKRVTKFGRFLRKSRLDELPQFYNILKGDMSVIGPRPERPKFVKELSHNIPFYQTRHIVKPGLTGWAQVKSRYGSSLDDSLVKLQYDLYYIKHRSFLLDLNIIFKTLSTVVFYRGQ